MQMREQQLEDILASYPDDFFPDRQFRLIGRQTSLDGVGRFDLLFEDRAGRKWLIELKAVALKITDTDQLMRYYEELHQRAPRESFIPCFVAPDVPPHVKGYLDGKGIEYREFRVAEFRRVASEHGLELTSTAPAPQLPESPGSGPDLPSRPATAAPTALPADPLVYDGEVLTFRGMTGAVVAVLVHQGFITQSQLTRLHPKDQDGITGWLGWLGGTRKKSARQTLPVEPGMRNGEKALILPKATPHEWVARVFRDALALAD